MKEKSCVFSGKSVRVLVLTFTPFSKIQTYLDFPLNNRIAKQTNKDGKRATTAQLYLGRDTFDQGHVTKNQPITVRILLSESLAMKQFPIFRMARPSFLRVL